MDSSLATLIPLYSFSTGRRLVAFRQLRTLTQSLTYAFPSLEAHLTAALDHDDATRTLERRYATTTSTTPSSKGITEARRVDILVDRTLSAIRDAAAAQANGADEGDPIIAVSESFLRTVFPKGVNDMTSLGFAEELAAVEGLVLAFKGELAPIVAELDLTRLTRRLASLAIDYRVAVDAPEPEVVSFGDLRAARAKGQQYLVQAVAQIVGKYWRNTPEDVAARAALMAPILKQNEAIRQALRAHRNPDDVNPDTGEVDPTAPAAEPVADPRVTP
jgi:hypothetical protein